MKLPRPSNKSLGLLGTGAVLAAVALVAGFEALHYSSSPGFCMSCHEMRVVGEQGWMRSPHYENGAGVVAECGDCHIPPETEFAHMLWVKARDGTRDVAVHLFGDAEPHEMDWEKLRISARAKISDSSCRQCHANLTARGLPIKTIVAHREYQRLLRAPEKRKCLDCHTEEFHGAFKQHLRDRSLARKEGGEQ